MRKIFLSIWVLGWLLFVVGLVGLIRNTPWHIPLLAVGLVLENAGFVLYWLNPLRR